MRTSKPSKKTLKVKVDPLVYQSFQMQPRKGDLRKLQIIVAAVDCLAENGMEGGTLELVAKSLGIRRSHVAYYFHDREELLASAVQYVITVAQGMTIEKIKVARSTEERIQAMTEAAFEWAMNHPNQARLLMLFHYYCATHGEFRKLQLKIREAGRDRLQAMLLEKEPRGAEDAERALSFARALQAITTGCLLEALTTDLSKQGKAFEAIAVEHSLKLAREFWVAKDAKD